jgi:hypothetical protein
MPRVVWSLRHGRPRIEVVLTLPGVNTRITRDLLADTGAGTVASAFHLFLDDGDCRLFGGTPSHSVVLGGAYTGPHTVYLLRVQIPALAFDEELPVLGVAPPPPGFDGMACFRFLNRFTYGNFGNPDQFGLES